MTNRACPACGSEWFTTPGVTLSARGRVTGYEQPLVCRACGAPAANTVRAAEPDARSTVRTKAQRLASADPGVWVDWKTYAPEQATAARVAASDIRTGKIKTVAQIAGPVETRTVRLPDGSIQVQVARVAS